MTQERWEKLIGQLEDDGRVESKVTEDLVDRPGSADRVVVMTPLGRFRLSWTTEPKKLAEKAFYSKRGGSTVSVQATYDETEQIHIFSLEERAPSGAWQAVDASRFPVS